MLSKRVVLFAVALSFLFFTVPLAVHAQQVSTGSVAGTITDPSGAVIVGADVTLTDISTKASRKLVTNADGRYFFVNIPPGTYDLTGGKTGFRSGKVSGQTVTVGLTLTLNLKLEVGVATEVVEVQASTGAELQTLNSTVGTAFSGVALDSLPSITRDTSTFVVMQPGVTPEGSTSGAVMDQNAFQLDGGQNTNDMDGAMNIYTPSFGGDPSGVASNALGTGLPTGVMPTPIDSIEEFKVGTTQQTADFNSSAGAQVSMVTRRGHDAWHGTGYEYYLDNNWNANTFDNNASGLPIASYHYSRFGGAGGGPIIPKKILGGKTYFFGNYEGFRYPNSTTLFRAVPGPGLRQGLIDLAGTVYNLNPTTTTYTGPTVGDLVTGTVYPSATTQAACGGVSCDPRNLGVSPTLQALWGLMPAANVTGCPVLGPSVCDGTNIQAFGGNVPIVQRSDFAVARVDHDFGDKEHFFSSYRFYRLTRATTSQTDFSTAGAGGIAAVSSRPQIPWSLAAGLTSNITNNFTNDFHYSYLRNFWLWGDMGAAPQLTGLGAALEPNGESATTVLSPYNVNTQSIRTRYWDGHDHQLRDDMTRVLGNHLLQWGGIYQHNYNQHQRSDNGGGINYFPVDQLGSTTAIDFTNFIPAAVMASSATVNNYWKRDYSDALGLLTTDQIVYTRSGPQLTLNPPETPVEDRVTIPYYNTYFTDSWHIKPTVTLTYGLAWTLEMPPTEASGEQVLLVDDANVPIGAQAYLNTREQQARQGTIYNPNLGFSLVGNANGGQKYPYNPYYGQFSPRLAVAWSPNFDNGILGDVIGRGKTVVRGGFSVIYGRLNGVNLVLVPLLGTGLLQPVQCVAPTTAGTCPGTGGSTPMSAFRIGPTAGGWDGLTGPLAAPTTTLPQPVFPGINNTVAATSDVLDPNFRPNKSYEMDFTIQRQIGPKFMVEAGYIGRVIRNEYMPIDLNAVPYMLTCDGTSASCPGGGAAQSFANAYASVVMAYCGGVAGLAGGGCTANAGAVTAQNFFETALGGTGSAYCTGFASCTAAVVSKEGSNLSNQQVYNLWKDLGPSFVFGRSMENTPFSPPGTYGATGQLTSGVATNTSLGFGNYNALFFSTRMSDWHGLTMQSNFTYSHTLGTGALYQAASEYTVPDPYDLNRGYGNQAWDRKYGLNMFMVYQPPYYKNQQGVIGHILGGWSVAPIFVTGSGIPVTVFPCCYNFNLGLWGQAFGEADNVNYYTDEQAVRIPGPGCSNFGTSRLNQLPIGGAANSVYGLNLYKNPQAVFNCFRNPVLGFDNGHNGGYGNAMRGQPYYNVDMQIRKTTNITERVSVEFQVAFYNMLNHVQLSDPFNSLNDPGDWGQLESQLNTPRAFEFGGRIRF